MLGALTCSFKEAESLHGDKIATFWTEGNKDIYIFLSSNLPIRSVFIIAADFEEGAAIDLDIKQQSYMKHLLRC